ncbi:MAG: nucleoside hydrolase [Clostridia bacterium]|nr:nucleoside hydrolase [Clostridia bacterium]
MMLRLKNTEVPKGIIDAVLDTDTYNEVDDQFALAYMLKSKERFDVKAVYAAPFYNAYSQSPKDGMEKSYAEILNILNLAGEKTQVYKGSDIYLKDEKTPVVSDAALDLVERAKNYSDEKPLYVVAIGAITNVASAILLEPKIIDKIVVVWLGGHAHHYRHTMEFNMKQDIAAARVVLRSGVSFVQLPCRGVVDRFYLSRIEVEYYFKGKGALADYLCDYTVKHISEEYGKKDWTKIIWDVVAVAYLLNDNDRFMLSRLIPAKIPSYENAYVDIENAPIIRYVYAIIDHDAILEDLVKKITE